MSVGSAFLAGCVGTRQSLLHGPRAVLVRGWELLDSTATDMDVRRTSVWVGMNRMSYPSYECLRRHQPLRASYPSYECVRRHQPGVASAAAFWLYDGHPCPSGAAFPMAGCVGTRQSLLHGPLQYLFAGGSCSTALRRTWMSVVRVFASASTGCSIRRTSVCVGISPASRRLPLFGCTTDIHVRRASWPGVFAHRQSLLHGPRAVLVRGWELLDSTATDMDVRRTSVCVGIDRTSYPSHECLRRHQPGASSAAAFWLYDGHPCPSAFSWPGVFARQSLLHGPRAVLVRGW